ncbi:MAG: hypothetical protein JNG90_04130 [Planctomycetaceae bacterium]|nr:hypothetical protein [Planctomycetaceae bacterium]
MSDEVAITQEQANMLTAGIQPAIDSLLESGNFVPTLYVHDSEGMTFFSLVSRDAIELREIVRQVIRERMPPAIAYALLYDSSVETDEGPLDVLVVETGDTEDEEAHEFVKAYSRQRQWAATGLARLGAAPHLLK